MNILEMIRTNLLNKNFKDLDMRQLALVTRYNNLVKQELSDEEIEQKLNNELEEAKTLRKNSVTNVTSKAGAAAEFVPESVTIASLIDLSDDAELNFLKMFNPFAQALASQVTKIPIIGTEGEAIVKTESTPTSKFREAKEGLQDANSASVEIKANTIYSNIVLSADLLAYSIIELEALFLARLKRAILKTVAIAIVNSDDTKNGNVNLKEDDVSALSDYATNARYNFGKGLRAIGLHGGAKSSLDFVTITDMNSLFDLSALVTSASTPGAMFYLMNSKAYNAYRKTEDFKNASKNGQVSTIAKGVIDIGAGSYVFCTSYDILPLTDADGKVSKTKSKNTQGTVIAVDPRVIQSGSFGEIKTNDDADFAVSTILEALARWGMAHINDKIEGKNFVAVGYNCQ